MLTDTQVRNAKPRAKPYRLYDVGGLYLEVSTAGGKWWRLKYRFKGKEKRISLGTYPSTGLRDARDKRDAARRQLAAGIDVSAARKAEKAAEEDTLEAVAREWHRIQSASWDKVAAETTMRRLQAHVFPSLGSQSVTKITVPALLAVLRSIEHLGTGNVVQRIRGCLGQVFQFAIATGRCERNPAKELEGALRPVKHGHYAAITDPKEVGALLRAIDAYRGSMAVRCALRLAPLTFVRPGELRAAEWSEIDLDRAEWNIAAGRMKTHQSHLVPLSAQAVTVLRELLLVTQDGRYVFSGRGGKPISENAMNNALRSMGFGKNKMTAHGFRAMARTIIDEVLGVRPDFIEHQLAHTVRDPLGRAYNRTTHLPERRAMMQAWADYLDGLRNGAEVVPIRGTA